MNVNAITRYIGIALLLNALFMLISAIVSVLYDLDASFSPLILSSIITFMAGCFPLIFVRNMSDINLKEGITTVVFSWLLSCLFGMLPYILYGGEFSVINSWYESVSGYTTTGSTILTNVEVLPKGLLFWRSSTHWLGGIGVVLFMLLLLPSVSEISSLSRNNFKLRTKQTIRVITVVYVGLTVIETFCLTIAGMSFFDAINHSFSTIATGGFSTRNLSVSAFHSASIEIIMMVFMLVSGMHFGFLYGAFTGKTMYLFKSPVIRYYLLSTLIGGLLVSLNIKFAGTVDQWGQAFRNGFFQIISSSSTAGFGSTDTSAWPDFSKLLFLVFMIQCACSGSTTGGIKADRVWIFLKAVKSQIVKQLHPNAVVPVKIGNRTLEADMVHSACLFISLYLFIVFIVALLLSLMGMDSTEAISGSIANMSNAGHGLGSIGSLGNYSNVPAAGKFLLSIEMLLGRMEIYPLMLVLFIHKWR